MSEPVALYIDPRGPYPKLLGVGRCWDETRDAQHFAGDEPIVAHPPCGPWGRLRHMYRGNEHALAPLAVAQLRRNGGVLEHPAGSRLWGGAACSNKRGPLPGAVIDLPFPGDAPDQWGGYTIEVCQCDWGHVARKRTWLYVVGCPLENLPPFPEPREPTHWISGGRGREGKKRKTTPVPPGIKVCSAQQRRRTPLTFAEWLIEVARRC